jgi:septum formation protein
MDKIRLCSNSPTRAKLLKKFGVDFIQSRVDFNEDLIKANLPRAYVYLVAKGKFKKALETYGLEIPILVADTVVASKNGEILRKAKDVNEAREILLKQSGSEISIITAMIFKKSGLEFVDVSATKYFFEKFDKNDLESYLKSNLWQGKAGACMVEGFCKKYIKKVEGLESNAMGLAVEKLIPWLEF